MNEQVKILFVDDEKNVLKSLERLFLDEDYEILTANSGKEGLEILKDQTPIQIIISDYRMPDMNGVEFLKKAFEQWPDSVRIILSGYADASVVVSAINDGHIYKFIPKPWNDDELKITVANAVERHFLYQKTIQLTNELNKQAKTLQKMSGPLDAQFILDSLPLIVVGLDSVGRVSHLNRGGLNILKKKDDEIIGEDREKIFSKEVNNFIDCVISKKDFSSTVTFEDTQKSARGITMNFANGDKGVLLLFEEAK